MQTRAAVVEGQGQPFTMAEVELDAPRDDEVLVRMVATGLCHTDITMGSFLPAEMFPNVFGHEGAGVVEEVGADVAGIEAGDHVVMSFRSCRDCAKCRAGLVGYCDQTLLLNYMGMRMDGSHDAARATAARCSATSSASPAWPRTRSPTPTTASMVDPALDLTLLAPYGCGFQTGAGTVLNVLKPATDDSLVVYGVGAVGLAAIAAAAAEGVESIIAVDPLAEPARASPRRSARPPWTPTDARRRERRRPGQGAHRRRRGVRHRHHRDPRGGQAGAAVAGRPRHPGRARPRRRGVRRSTRSTCSRAARP